MEEKTKSKQDLENIKISSLEKCFINWPSPFEYPIALGLKFLTKDRYSENPYFKNGIWKGLVDAKVKDYKRLIRAGNQDRHINTDILNLYGKFICGQFMMLTYHLFHDKRNI